MGWEGSPSTKGPASESVLDLKGGTPIGRCTLVAVGPVVNGGIAVTLRSPRGETFHVDVLGRDPGAPGIARAGSLAVYLENGGAGATATDEDQGLGAMALARVLAQREKAGMRVPVLLTIRQRAPLMSGPAPERLG
jgi:hypothetical protein